MASGASNTTRQLGLATGLAGLSSIFQSKIEATLTPLVAGMPASSHVHELARAVTSGGTGRALQAVSPADRDKVAHAAHPTASSEPYIRQSAACCGPTRSFRPEQRSQVVLVALG
jgi:hypothetical protein